MEYRGLLKSFDNYMNFQLLNTEEYVDGVSQGNLGECLIRFVSEEKTGKKGKHGCRHKNGAMGAKTLTFLASTRYHTCTHEFTPARIPSSPPSFRL